MSRKLATVQMIEDVLPIEGAEFIEKIRIKGWWCVAKKGEFKKGDKCIYHEIDSLLPPVEQYNFLAKGTSLKKTIIDTGKEVEGYRLKTVRLRGQISQGLALPLSLFKMDETLGIDTDVSELLNIYKYNPPLDASISGDAKGYIPGYIPRTDEERVQNCIPLLEQYKGHHFYGTSKIDGTSCTFFKYENEFEACGHNINFKESNRNIFWILAKKYDLINKLLEGYAVQGEVAGEGIQKNRLKLKGVDFYSFYVFDIKNHQYLELDDMNIFIKDLGLKMVPVIYEDFILDHSCDELLKLADIPSPLNPDLPQEGIVFRLKGNTDKISFKVISNEYLLKWGL